MKQSYVYALVTLLAFGIAGCGKKTEETESAATVNGDAISEKDLLSHLAMKMNVTVATPQGAVPAQASQPLALQGLEDLIKRKVWMQIAKEDNLLPTDADVKAELDKRVADNPTYITGMTQQLGLTLDQIKAEVLADLVQYKLLTKGVTVTKDDVDQYIKENKSRMVQPATAEVLAVAVSTAKKKQPVDQALASGESFQSVANHYNEDPAISKNGNKISLNLSAAPPQLAKLIEGTPVLKATDWVSNGGPSFVKFYVQSKTPAKPIEITDKVRDAIQRQLALQRGQIANDLDKMALDKVKASKIDVNVPGLKNMWDTAFANMKNQPATPGSPSAPSPGASPTAPGATPSGSGASAPAAPR